jgi:acylaminoacyl-peptidase
MKHKINFPFYLLSSQRSHLALLLLAIISSSVDAEEKLAIFDPMDVFDLEWASDPRVSPDGSSIVYVRKSNDIMTDRERSH